MLCLQEAGYPEPLLAHHLLYPAEGSTRELLLYLLTMLPPDGVSEASTFLVQRNSNDGGEFFLIGNCIASFPSQAPSLPPPASSSGSETLHRSDAEEIPGSNPLSSDLVEGEGVKEASKSQDMEVQPLGESGEALKEGTAVEAGGQVEDGTDFGKERDVTPVQEPGESQDVEGVEQDAVNSNKGLIVDEQDESRGTLKNGGASRERRGADSPAAFDEHMKAVSSSPVEPGSAKSGVGDPAGGQPYESEEGGVFVPGTEVPDERPGPFGTETEGSGVAGWMEQHDEQEGEEDVFGGHARLQAGVGGGKEAVRNEATASSMGEVETTKGLEESSAVLPKKAVHEAEPREDQDTIAPTTGKEGLNGDDIGSGDGDSRAPSSSVAREQRVDEMRTESGSAGTAPDARPTAEEMAVEGCDAAEAEGAAGGVEIITPEECQSMGENAVRSRKKGEEELEAPRRAVAEVTAPLAQSVGLREDADGEQEAAAGEDSGEEDIVFLQVRCAPYTYILMYRVY